LGANGQFGTQTLSWYYFASSIGLGPANGNVTWQDPNGVIYGVNIHIPIQVYHIGKSPFYQITTDGSTWITPVRHPSDPTSTSISGSNNGTSYDYDISITPTAGGTVSFKHSLI
jgi:hypothetical protein